MRATKNLDYNLQAYQERLGLVNFLEEQGEFDGMPPSELDKVANYLLYAEDVDAEVELKQGSKKKISYEELIESATGENAITAQQTVSIYRIPKPRIDRDEDKDIPYMKDLWEAIDIVSEQYQYCKDVLDGKREMDTERKLIPTYQTKYFLREWMVDLRREQFLLKDCFKPVITVAPSFAFYTGSNDEIGMCIGDHVLCKGARMVDFGNWQHIYAMLKYYTGMKALFIDNPFHPWWGVYDFLEELIDRIPWSDEHWHILMRKIDKIPNEEIAKELFDINGRSYSVNYISTIFKQHISKEIVKYAYLWWDEKVFAFDGTLKTAAKWKICPVCERQLFVDPLNFGQNIDGTWKDICKLCVREQRLEEEKAKEDKHGRKNVKRPVK